MNLRVGQELELCHKNIKIPYHVRVSEVHPDYVVFLNIDSHAVFSLTKDLLTAYYTWSSRHAGSNCRRCKAFNQDANPDNDVTRTHVCTGCKHDGWHIWGDKRP